MEKLLKCRGKGRGILQESGVLLVWTQNDLVSKGLAKWWSVPLWTKWFWVRVQLQSLTFKFCACFKQGVPWHSGNYGVWIHSEIHTWHDKNIQSVTEADRWTKVLKQADTHTISLLKSQGGTKWCKNRIIAMGRSHKYIQKHIWFIANMNMCIKDVHVRFTAIWKYIIPLSSFVSPSLPLKHCFSCLKFEWDLRLYQIKVKLNINDGNWILCYYCMKIHPLLSLWLIHFIMHNRTKSTTYVNPVHETQTQEL